MTKGPIKKVKKRRKRQVMLPAKKYNRVVGELHMLRQVLAAAVYEAGGTITVQQGTIDEFDDPWQLIAKPSEKDGTIEVSLEKV